MSKYDRYNEYKANPVRFVAMLRVEIKAIETRLAEWLEEERDADDDGGWASNHVEELGNRLQELKGELPENVLWHIEQRYPGNTDTERQRILKKAMKVRLGGGSLERFLA